LGFASAAGDNRPAQTAAGLRFNAAGYLPQFFNNKRTLSEADPVLVTAPGDTDEINVVLLRGVFLPLIQP
jgi:hypothetical protein